MWTRVVIGTVIFLHSGPSFAQLSTWRLGGSGLSWTSQAAAQSGALEVGGALQPLELRDGENLIGLLRARGLDWLNGQPRDFTATGQPRAWSNDGYFNQLNGPVALLDGDPSTSSQGIFKTAINQAGAAFFFDLGAPFPINRIRFFPDPNDPDAYIKAFAVLVNDGVTFNDISRPDYEILRRVEANRDMVVDLEFASTQGRFLQLLVLSKTPFNLAEFEVYGQGFVPLASYESQLHAFGGAVNFGNLRLWSTRLAREGGPTEAAPVALVQLRTGGDDTPLRYFRRNRESGAQEEVTPEEFTNRLPRRALFRRDSQTGALLEEVDRTTYLNLPVPEQGPILDFVQGDVRGDVRNWSPWSPPLTIDATGLVEVPVGLPSPRQYMQFRIGFTGDADNVIRIDSLAVEYSPGLVSDAVGEVALAHDLQPARGVLEVVGGIDTTFVYEVRTDFATGGLTGYRGLRIEAFPAPVFRELWAGDPPTVVEDAVVLPTATGFDVYFEPVTEANNRPLRVYFDLRPLESNTPIEAWLLGDGQVPPHPVRAGDASDDVTTGVTNAFTVESRPTVEAQLSTVVVSPNDDGHNDVAAILLILSQFSGELRVEVDVYDLSGRRVRRLVSRDQSAGASQETWDARDDAGNLVPPGVYVLSVAARSDAKAFASTQLVGVAY